jgi:prepilin-type processing-associated H-X9-DG protein
MRLSLLLLLILASCGPSERSTARVASPCAQRVFEETRFTICEAKAGAVEIQTSDRAGQPYRTFTALAQALGPRAGKVAFAMNAGMFGEDGHAIGLLIEDGKQVHAINRREGGGNFHLMPNGVFLVRNNGGAEIVESAAFKPSKDIAFATQSGPMLVIDGKLHRAFEPDGQSRYVRNAVGIGRDGTPLFVISQEPVSFGKLARLFRDQLGARNALYFDGSVSSLWDPSDGRQDSFVPLGPMVVVFRDAESAPGREGRARP